MSGIMKEILRKTTLAAMSLDPAALERVEAATAKVVEICHQAAKDKLWEANILVDPALGEYGRDALLARLVDIGLEGARYEHNNECLFVSWR